MLYLAPIEDLDSDSNNLPGDYTLPTRENDEYKGFQRKLPEVEFWK